MKRKIRKLDLHRETLHLLGGSALHAAAVAGAAMFDAKGNIVRGCCYRTIELVTCGCNTDQCQSGVGLSE